MTIAPNMPCVNDIPELDADNINIKSTTGSMNQVIEETVSEAREALADPFRFEHPISRIAVVGAGPAGMAATKALLEQGFDVQVYERHEKVGGNWLFSEPTQDIINIPTATEKDGEWLQRELDNITTTGGQRLPSGIRSGTFVKCTDDVNHWLRNHHHPPSACYSDLNNNTAAPVLGSYDFSWPKDTPYYTHHSKIQQYYEDYVDHFDLRKYIEFNTSLDAVEKRDDKWHLTLTRVVKDPNGGSGGDQVSIYQYQSTFDAVVIATGQYQDPFVPSMDGLYDFATLFPDRLMHSKQFTRTDEFKNKNVLVVGGRVSAIDVARLVSVGAKQVYLSYRGPFITDIALLNLIRSVIPKNVIHKPGIEGFWSKDSDLGEKLVNGTITFSDGSTLNDIDMVIFATGYRSKHSYFGASRMWATQDKKGDHFILKDGAKGPLVVMNDKTVHNTYKDIFLISDPTLAFAGAPRHITTTPFFDYQAHAIGRVWSQHAFLPSQAKMKAFSLKRIPLCPSRMDYESESLKPQILLPWLNLHAALLVPDLHLPVLMGPPDYLEAVWNESVDIWKESIRRQQMEKTLEL